MNDLTSPGGNPGRLRIPATIALLLLALACGYSSLWTNGFVGIDDHIYITENPVVQQGLSKSSLAWAFSTAYSAETYWHPLTWLSLMLDHDLFGLNPVGYHLVNLLLHTANVLLLLWLLVKTTGRFWPSAFVAALFALHPLNVEAVAWAVERKTVLSGFFWLATMLLYVRYARNPGYGRYAAVLAAFGLGLLSKPAVITLPAVLLLLDFWPLGRFSGTEPRATLLRLVGEKIPFVVAVLVYVFGVVLAIKGLMHSDVDASWGQRVANALVSYVGYLGKLVYPAGLAVFYPLKDSYPSWQVGGAVAFLAAVTALVIRYGRTYRWLITGWFWYLFALVPTSGLLRAGLWPEMADRFAYLPLIGVYLLVGWGGAELVARRERLTLPVAACAGTSLILLTICTWRQTGYWHDNFTLFGHAVQVTKDNAICHKTLGIFYLDAGKPEEALVHMRRLREIDPEDPAYEWVQARIALSRGDIDTATRLVKTCLAKKENYVRALDLSAQLNERAGNIGAAIEACNRIIHADDREGRKYRENARLTRQRLLPAVAPMLDSLRRNVASRPQDLAARGTLALKLDELGFFEEALAQYRELEQRGMNGWQLYFNAGNACKKLSRYRDAARYYEKSLAINPRSADAANNLGVVYRKLNDPEAAKRAFQRAMAADPSFSYAPFNLALIYRSMKDTENARRYLLFTREKFPALADRVDPFLAKLAKTGRN
jgi:tetratricopeptide (TPR) repeat protein